LVCKLLTILNGARIIWSRFILIFDLNAFQIIDEENLNSQKNDIKLKRFRYIECLISNNVKLFGLKLYFRLTTYTVIDLSDGDRWLGSFRAVPCMKKKLYRLNWNTRYYYVCFTGK